ncbi:hypothetical protein PSTG_05184 [Puccinia striiformis f. sp. tritici PST-78]|uniref:Uncharacterized protein n=1 Tax=Puccinia striiformis f. sp. tritici PST-78 TaxID=1165861 RepID=A0A0L0VRW5_9BASI|nr:hypothetical protein PSTG_05184 [Puccinia striiformis f. sp. tritici PST-78]
MRVQAWFSLPAKLAWMAASKLILGKATRIKLGGCAPERFANGLKPNGQPGVYDSLGAQHLSLYWMATPESNSDAAIQASFVGSVYSCGTSGPIGGLLEGPNLTTSLISRLVEVLQLSSSKARGTYAPPPKARQCGHIAMLQQI